MSDWPYAMVGAGLIVDTSVCCYRDKLHVHATGTLILSHWQVSSRYPWSPLELDEIHIIFESGSSRASHIWVMSPSVSRVTYKLCI